MMELSKHEHGFTLSYGGVTYDFSGEVVPFQNGTLYEIDINGSIPVPKTQKGDRLLLPVDEGIAVKADGSYADGEYDCNQIGRSFCCRGGVMSMIIVEREKKFLLIALSSGLHAFYSAIKQNGLYRLSMQTDQECKVSYGIFDTLVEACRAYRQIKNINPLTLTEKMKKNPEIEKLVGGGIFWVWNDLYDEVMYSDHNTDIKPEVGDGLLRVAERLHAKGVERALFGIFFKPDYATVGELYQKYGYISAPYDNYNDVLNPALLEIIPNNRVQNCDYTRRRMKDYPEGVRITESGEMAAAWALKGFDGQMHNQNTLCPVVAAERIREEIPEFLRDYPDFKGWFIDVYGCSVSACYSPVHPVTREECIEVKKGAFNFLSDIGLIAGTEDGFEDLVDSLVYAEGLHSPVYWRNHDSGRKHANMYDGARAEHIRVHMLSPENRVPLWHLVYHDCLFAFPYWGDSMASSHELLRDKIIFACLYGCPPLYSFFLKDFDRVEEDILESYQKIGSVNRKVATLPMTDYSVLTDDYMIQRSAFGGKYEVVVNFSDESYVYGEKTVAPHDFIFIEK